MIRSRTAASVAVPFLLALLLAALVGGASLAHQHALDLRAQVSEVDAHVMVPFPGAARIMSMGANELATDLVWIRTLIYYGDGLNRDNGVPDVELLVALMNDLDPRFRRAYWWGGYSTTFRHATATQEEYRSSVAILRRGVAVFPSDWELSWLLGLRLFFDVKPDGPRDTPAYEKQREEGAYYIERAMHLPGAPGNLPMTAAAMRSELGQRERGLREVREMILTTEDPKAREALQKRYADLASDAASEALLTEAQSFIERWKRELPYAPQSFYVLVGPPPDPAFDLEKMLAGPEFGSSMAAFGP